MKLAWSIVLGLSAVLVTAAGCTNYHADPGGSADAGDGADASGGEDSGSGVRDSGGGGCAATCPTGCCGANGSCVASTAQTWAACGAPGTACVACNKGVVCNGGCDNAHWAPSTMLTLTVTQLYVTAAWCNDTVSTPNPYGVLVFDDVNPPRTASTGVCSSPVCEPPSNQILHVQASWLTDGLTTYAAWDNNTFSSNYKCWGGPYPFTAPLAVMATYAIPVMGSSTPGMEFALTAE